ncbi:zinc-dependent alcohol dehydrogenase [Aureliella helgolandensis]|uniref:Sorbitol dehydrogenase n=1 Tax=Aureliella helgolandensis TaxID=2527968 RepID=A0A518GFV1_9BACT|nr:galactitol-1-phosphate 5-dehydrogenase [Aureliella helgolandensis]QDV27427.1 Sorbitol dehydrogenase [Aureliella helgolandensis]
MKAMLLSEYKKLEIVDMPQPEIGHNELLIKVRACGICGSDIHGWDGSTGRRVPPLVMGHEAAGVVEKVGSQVTGFQVGDHLTFDSTVSCGTCGACRKGSINLCENRQVLGVSCDEFRRHGAFAEYVVVPQNICYALPKDLPFEHAALIEAVSIAVHAANRSAIKLGDTAVVVGSGMIGLLVVQAVRLAGCARVIAVDLEDSKLEIAKSLGADFTLNPKSCDVVAEVKKLTGGQGADVAFEVVGATPTVKTAIESTRKGGSITLVGNLAPNVELPLQAVVTRELTIYGSCASNGEYPECIEYLRRGDIKVQPLITATATLEDGPAWFARLYAGEPGAMKVVLQPQG